MLPSDPSYKFGVPRHYPGSQRRNRRRALIARRWAVYVRSRYGRSVSVETEHAGSPDYEIAQLPDGLVGE